MSIRRVGSSPVSRTTLPLWKALHHARVVELADSLDSGSSVLYGRAGSSPASRTSSEILLTAALPAFGGKLRRTENFFAFGRNPLRWVFGRGGRETRLFGAQRSAKRTAPPLAGFYWNCRKNPPWFFPQTPFSSRCLGMSMIPLAGRGISLLPTEGGRKDAADCGRYEENRRVLFCGDMGHG